ncbi:F-box-like protein (macronuclear) [Tetrahymena thermophila SB210]|uniref:F-box-like protein n=1 Tax=Tetrahymena thermophila (strain SB210) TaxID=312017 RepID=W7XC36_TETTS|nr:F-box-like protein [Tetrahymena thermophila SB210]EWS74033.1 F-box-like protein [Tetrahymena thermophila SB210]|eukprot:XP_012653432.1 F-box-like protein [Tetrahymena thermophila SB210]
MDIVDSNYQQLQIQSKEVNLQPLGIMLNKDESNQLEYKSSQKQQVKQEEVQESQNIDKQNVGSEDTSNQEEEEDDDFDFDFEKIKQRAQARQSHLPKWFLETDKQLTSYNNKVIDVQNKLEHLGQGLKEFEEKRRDHQQQLKEERRRYLAKKYQLEDPSEFEKNGIQDLKTKSSFFCLNQHILIKILEFVSSDLVSVLLKMSKVCKRFYYLSRNDQVWKNICRELLGHPFVDLNENNQQLFEQKAQEMLQIQSQNLINKQNQVVLKSQKSKELQKQKSNLISQRTYWMTLAQYFIKEFNVFKQTLKHYRNQNCPSVVFARSDMIKGLKLVNEIFSLVALNMHKNFQIYCKLMNFLKDSYIKGVYCLSQLALMEEENIRYDAFDALFSFISLEKGELSKFRVFHSISNFLNKCKFSEEKKLKVLLASEIAQLQEQEDQIFDQPSLLFTSLLYNQKILADDASAYCYYDINSNQNEISLINGIIQSNQLQNFVGFTIKRDTNQLFELQGQIQFNGDQFEGFGTTSDSGNLEINGKIKFTHNQTLKKIYEVYNTIPYFGKGVSSLTTSYSQIQAPKSFTMYASFSYIFELSSQRDSKKLFTLYGTSENLRDILVIKI